MADTNIDLTIYQGDSFPINVTGLPTDKNYTYYLGFKAPDGNFVGKEIPYSFPEGKPKSAFSFDVPGNYSNQFVVPDEARYADYSYAIKICFAPDYEETLTIKGRPIGTKNIIRVYRKEVEGI